MDQIVNLKQLFTYRLILLYMAEVKVRTLLMNLKNKVHSLHLHRLTDDHLERNRLHIENLHSILSQVGVVVPSSENEAISSLGRELEIILDRCKESEVIDASIIGCMQNVIHYLISGYGTCKSYATTLDLKEAAKILTNILEEEKQQDKRLSRLAEENINVSAKTPIAL